MDAKEVNDQIASLVEAWCERRELEALGGIMPVWLSNNGLTDGWEGVAAALRTLSNNRELPDSERDLLKRLWVEVDFALRNRQ
jgi:hypothetical protein